MKIGYKLVVYYYCILIHCLQCQDEEDEDEEEDDNDDDESDTHDEEDEDVDMEMAYEVSDNRQMTPQTDTSV